MDIKRIYGPKETFLFFRKTFCLSIYRLMDLQIQKKICGQFLIRTKKSTNFGGSPTRLNKAQKNLTKMF